MSKKSDPRHPRFARSITACLLAFTGLASGCNGTPPTTPTVITGPGLPPAPVPTTGPFAVPVVMAVSPSVGSTGGGATVEIQGTGFLGGEGGPVVIFGGVHAPKVFLANATRLVVTVPPHAAGTVDIVVTNDDGQSARLANGYTFVATDSIESIARTL